jgi:hypothetical protein
MTETLLLFQPVTAATNAQLLLQKQKLMLATFCV